MDTLERWNDAAGRYMEEQEVSELAECNRRIVGRRFPGFKGEKVLDLGCGYGFYTNYFHSIGADVTGVDGSDGMLRLARENYPDCRFYFADFRRGIDFADESFDLIFSNLVLMDVEDVVSIFAECRRMLKRDGLLYYVILHPAFYDGTWLKDEEGIKYAKAIRRYIRPYELINTFWGETVHFHRPISYYLNAAAQNGLMLVHTEEPAVYDGIKKTDDIPLFFFAEYKKA